MSVETSEAGQVDQEASRVRILRAAAEIAAESGYAGASISKITKRSGLPASSVYWFFRDKDQLMAEVIRHSLGEWLEAQPRWEVGRGSAAAGLRAILTRSVRSLVEAPAFLRIGHMLVLQSREVEPEARQYFVEVRQNIELDIAHWMAGHLGPEVVQAQPLLARELARLVLAVTDGAFLADQTEVSFEVDDFVEIIVAVVECAVESAGGVDA